MYKDSNGQVANAITLKDRIKRDTAEFVGICKGLIADGVIVQDEVEFICNWMRAHPHLLDTWPMSVLIDRLGEILADGVVDQDEELDLLKLIGSITGGNPVGNVQSLSTDLPLTHPAPDISFNGTTFCVTGTFEFGSRSKVSEAIIQRGGIISPSVKRDTNVLVIGAIGSRDWKQSTFGTKIEKAISYQQKGINILIVSESHFTNFLAMGQ
ncbi:BRCT domain-containing protein [Paludibacterium denitrificans]|uniref:NAD-dependent DNA ligase n=1 Tax=Paludibacterium denitrificans TaxID=2675226 RepID=A0A844GHV5_9NEIS|nr:BRCT domain-containing protein [Paludibacterium denitrificans]MTD34075.1 NAD-dependent DNA ligase [Paludibacterium denitrificans]